ncbi:MAG: hypothetical protein ACYTFG_01340 [Planctomycetota bacterium]
MDEDNGEAPPPAQWEEEGDQGFPEEGGDAPGQWDGGEVYDKASGRATGSMVCGILGLVLTLPVCCCGILGIPFGAVGFILGLVATILGVMERGAIARGESSEAGAGQAKAGMILGIIAMVLAVIFVILMVLAVALNLGMQQGGGSWDFSDLD